MTYEVTTTVKAQRYLRAIKHGQTKAEIIATLLALSVEPLLQGKPLRGNLAQYRSVRAAKNRYRVIYSVAIIALPDRDQPDQEGSVTVIGIRKEGDKRDVYELAAKRLG
jgi:mRNA interferase RelE/StbE